MLPVDGGAHPRGRPRRLLLDLKTCRTVLWGWRGEPFDDEERAGLERVAVALRGDLARELAPLLSRAEIGATKRRVDELLDRGRFPYPRGDWPAILATFYEPRRQGTQPLATRPQDEGAPR